MKKLLRLLREIRLAMNSDELVMQKYSVKRKNAVNEKLNPVNEKLKKIKQTCCYSSVPPKKT